MFEEDHAPVTLSESHQQAASGQRTVELPDYRRSTFQESLSLRDQTDVIINRMNLRHSVVFHPALFERVGELSAYWRATARELNTDALRKLEGSVLLNI
jgi:hypothetical protein